MIKSKTPAQLLSFPPFCSDQFVSNQFENACEAAGGKHCQKPKQE